jgi:small subunit ribosomal protein S20
LANHKSALKRAHQNEIRRLRNKSVKTRMRNIVKDIRLSVRESSKEDVLKKLDMAKSNIDRAAQKGVIHKKAASRKISRLSKLVNTIPA